MEGNGAVIEGVDDATAGTGSFGSGGRDWQGCG